MNDEDKPKQTPREKIAILAAMSPEEFSRFMSWHFDRICKEPLKIPLNLEPTTCQRTADTSNGQK